jgi:hypothetical protein
MQLYPEMLESPRSILTPDPPLRDADVRPGDVLEVDGRKSVVITVLPDGSYKVVCGRWRSEIAMLAYAESVRTRNEIVEQVDDFEQRLACGAGGIDALKATNDAMAKMIANPISYTRLRIKD